MSTSRSRCILLSIAVISACVVVVTYLHFDIRLQVPQFIKHSISVATIPSPAKRPQQRENNVTLEVQSEGNFTSRVNAFNVFLSSLRLEELRKRRTAAWRKPASNPMYVLSGTRDDYLQLLSNYTNVTTVVLPWMNNTSGAWSSLLDRSNLLIQNYYKWTADDRLCTWIETPGTIKMKYDAVYNRKCSRNINETAQPSSLEPLFLNGKPINRNQYWPNDGNSYPPHFYTNPPPYVFHMHIHRDALVTNLGDVFTDGLKLVLYACSNDLNPSLPSALENIPLYDEVFVTSQFWGTAVFHRMVEIVPRIALFVDFLKANPEIRILGPEVGGRLAELLRIIGLDASRLVTGDVRAKIVYQPRATGCGFANVQESQMLSQLYRDYIRRTFPPQPRNRLILVRRSGSRRFTEQKSIEEVLQRAAKDYNLTYTMFIDNPTPSLIDTMLMFHSAVVVIAPHGAGLSNVFFSQPGTYVVEGVCNLPHVNFCYQRLVHVLGHHWHGVTSRRGCEGVVDVSASNIESAVREYLRLWSREFKFTRRRRAAFRF